MTSTYAVIAKRYDDRKKDCVQYVVGICDCYFHASLLRDAYNAHYHTDAFVASMEDMADWAVKV